MTTQAFEAAYENLNEKQREAVDMVEGPVIVLAGPGTGKTSLLTVRVANIVHKTSAKPDEILVLTFTDSAARTVAKRLAMLMGDDVARKVGVFTFHRFSEEVIKRHPEAFPDFTDRRQMGEVEQVLLWREVIERHTSPALVPPKAPFHYLGDLRHLEDEMTRECLSVDAYRAWLGAEAERIMADESLRYVRAPKGGAVGDLKPEGKKRLERLEKGHVAADLIAAYRMEKEVRGIYGFTDVLRIAVDGLASDEALRADLQEQYQYVLADEHQDANALQHALLDALAFDEHPNLFIVGDEKQAIFGFQGADVSHFATFIERYPRAARITLNENYRSHAEVLALAHGLLTDLPSAMGEHTILHPARGAGGRTTLLTAPDPLAERDHVAALVEVALADGVPPHEIAVITRKNATADLFALHLRARGVSVIRAGEVDLESRPLIRFLLALMHATADPLNISALREALLAPWWHSASFENRARFLRQTSDRELEAALAETFPKIADFLVIARRAALEMPPLSVFSFVLSESGARDYLLSLPEAVADDIPLVRQLLHYIEELSRRAPNARFAEVMNELDQAREHGIGAVKTNRTSEEGSVTVITAHKAKGMEFERVFIAALTAREWEGRGKSALVPSPFDAGHERAETTRLFYVACTRAKDTLVLSYSVENGEGREERPMSLIPSGLESSTDVLSDPLPRLHTSVDALPLVKELTIDYLTHTGLSPSAYNEYLESPSSFFAKRVLRLSEPETRAIAAGNAVHAALAGYLRTHDGGTARAELDRSFASSLLPRGDTFDALRRHAGVMIDASVGNPFLDAEALAIEETFCAERVISLHGHGDTHVLLKGKVDALLQFDTGECIVDFKTSSSIDKLARERFKTQIAFYDLLLRDNGYAPASGRIIRLSEEGIDIDEKNEIILTNELRRDFIEKLNHVLRELLTGEWRTGAPSPYDALLTLFMS